MGYYEHEGSAVRHQKMEGMTRVPTQEQLIAKLSALRAEDALSLGLDEIRAYAGASRYLLVRYDLTVEQRLANIISSDWPFDVVRRIDSELMAACGRTTEIEKCTLTLQPGFNVMQEDVVLPEEISRQYCWIDFMSGHVRHRLLFLLPEHVAPSHDRLRQAGLFASYLLSTITSDHARESRETDLTEREVECLFWIAEGKTSEEIAVILGISRNTINNYITSIMRKTATRNRPEAVAYAVRHHLV